MRKGRRDAAERGSTLIETMVALGLFLTSAAGISSLMTHQLRMEVTNGTATTAIALGEQEMEDLRSLDYADIASRQKTKVVGNRSYALQTTVQPNTPAANMKTITVRASWIEPLGPKSTSLYAIYTAVSR